MIRGCQKRIYYVKNPESVIFDEAYFILRRNTPGNTRSGKFVSEDDMKREARRIVLQTTGEKEDAFKNNRGKLAAFIAGALISVFVIGICAAVIFLI